MLLCNFIVYLRLKTILPSNNTSKLQWRFVFGMRVSVPYACVHSQVFVPPPKTRKELPVSRQDPIAKMPTDIPVRMGKFARVFPFNDGQYIP